jgi:uncharacterized protein (DUF1499 family)
MIIVLLYVLLYIHVQSFISTTKTNARSFYLKTSNPISINEREQKSTTFSILKSLVALSIITPSPSLGIGIDSSGLLSPCVTDKECLSSQDDRPFCFLPPWSYDGTFDRAKEKLINALRMNSKMDLIADDDRYKRVQIDSGSGTDEVEFYYTPNDYTIQFRAYRKLDNNLSQFRFLNNDSNRNRLEKLRIQLGFEEIEVLRNRRRLFIFGESPFDTFGPPTIEFEEMIDNISGDMITTSSNNIISNSLYPIWETCRKRE